MCRSRSGWPHPRSLYRCILRFFFHLGGEFRLRFRFRSALNDLAHFFRNVHGNRAGVRFLFRDAEAGQKVNDGLRLDLQFAGQLVDSDLIRVAHALHSLLESLLLRLGFFFLPCFAFVLCGSRFRLRFLRRRSLFSSRCLLFRWRFLARLYGVRSLNRLAFRRGRALFASLGSCFAFHRF